MTSNFLTLEGGRDIHYLDWGNAANKQCILMIHGFNQSCHSWDEFCPRVCDQFRVIAIDQRGHGLSFHPKDGNYSSKAMTEDIYHIATKLGIAPFDLVGMSLGARNSVSFVTKYPNMVKSLILVDWSPQPNSEGLTKLSVMLQTEWPSFEEAVTTMLKFNPTRTRKTIEERLRHTLRQLPSGQWTWKVDSEAWVKHFNNKEFDSANVETEWELVKSIKTPTLLVQGKQSDILSNENAQKMISTAKNCRLAVVDKAGHSVAGDNPDGFHEVVMEFLGAQKHKL